MKKSNSIIPSIKLKCVLDFPNYGITKEGKIWSYHKNKWLNPSVRKDGYLTTTLYKRNKQGKKTFTLHKLVLETFIGKRPKGMQARHLNDNKLDNRLSNLKWGTPSENHRDLIKEGKHNCITKNNPFRKRGEEAVNNKFSDKLKTKAISDYLSGKYKTIDILRNTGISRTHFYRTIHNAI